MTKTAKITSRSASKPATKKSGATKAIAKTHTSHKAAHGKIPAVAVNANKNSGSLSNLNGMSDASRVIPRNRTKKTATYQKTEIVSNVNKSKTAQSTKKITAKPASAKTITKRAVSKKVATKKH